MPRRMYTVVRSSFAALCFVIVAALVFGMPAHSVFAAGTPVVTINAPTDSFIGEAIRDVDGQKMTLTFDNTGSSPGFGPYIDFIIPAIVSDNPGTDPGVSFSSATYLGTALTTTTLTFPGSGTGCVTHPYAVDTTDTPLQVCGTSGYQLVVIQLPFGSFTPAQPPIDVEITANISNQVDLNVPLPFRAHGGFRYGNTAVEDYATDPSIVGSDTTKNVNPVLMRLKKTYIGPEDETATGPNYVRQYLIEADVANGQTLTNFDLTDVLANSVQYVRVDETRRNGTVFTTTAPATPSTTTPGGTLTRRFATITGTAAENDASMLFSFYVPRLNSTNATILDPATGNDTTSIDDAKAQGSWKPIDTDDGLTTATSDATANDHTLTDKSIAVQKTVAVVTEASGGPTGPSPGDVLEYTINFQVSDYFTFDSLVVTDSMRDGQSFLSSFAPTLTVGDRSGSVNGSFSGATLTVDTSQVGNDPNPATDGTTVLTFRVSQLMQDLGDDGVLRGGRVIIPDAGAATGTIKFRATILNAFTDTYPSGEPVIDHGDIIRNDLIISGRVLNNTTLAPTDTEDDDTSAFVEIVSGELSKFIYAVNGVVCPNQACTSLKVAARDTVTYRIQYTLPASNFEGLVIEDYLPLPVFDATTVTAFDDVAAGSTPTTIPPANGRATFGPGDTYHNLASRPTPTITTSGPENSLFFNFGDYDGPDTVSTIDLLFTVTVSDNSFADGLFLTNQAHVDEGSTNNGVREKNAIVLLQLTEPVLNIKKGVVATNGNAATFSPATVGPVTFNAPGTTGARFTGTITSNNLVTQPINSNLSGVDAGDKVTFAIVVENTGIGLNGAFDVTILDTLPAGFAIPSDGLNLRVSDGTGAVMTTNGSDLFGAGIVINDPGATATPTGAIDPYNATSGRNIAIVTYDLVVANTAQPSQALVNTAKLSNYASAEGGPDFTATDLSETASVTIAAPTLSKALQGTNQAHTTNADVAIGEQVQYRVTVKVPEGTTNQAQVADTLATGLAFVRVDSITASPGVSTSASGGFAGVTPTVTTGGRSIVFNLGNVSNANTDNAAAETIIIDYTAVVLNTAANVRGQTRTNSAVFSWDPGTGVLATAAGTTTVTIVEPRIQLTKTASPASNVDAGDEITFSIVVSHDAASNANAYDVAISDVIPTGMTYVANSLVNSAGLAPTTLTQSGGTINATYTAFPTGSSSTIQFRATLNTTVQPGQPVVNTVNGAYTSLPGDVTTAQSSYDATSTERTGNTTNPGGSANTYIATANTTTTVRSLAALKELVTTSEAFTSGSNVAVGEIIRYRIAARVPEGTSPDLQLRDLLPNGLTFLNDNTAKVLFVANGAGITSSTLSGAGLSASGNTSTVASIPSSSVVFGLNDAAISTSPTANNDAYATGTDVIFKFGNVVNSDSDTDSEYVIVELNALVDNSVAGSNDAGETLANQSRAYLGATANSAASGPVNVIVVEPLLTSAKIITDPASAKGDAGDVVTYRLTVSNPAGSNQTTAFDTVISDPMPTDLQLDTSSVTFTPSGGATGVTNTTSGNTVTINIATMPVGSSIVIEFKATIQASATPSAVRTNTVTARYTSLPGTSGTASNPTGSVVPGAAGSDNGERTGSGTAPNDLVTTASKDLTIEAIVPTKVVRATSEAHTSGSTVAVGEIVRYRVVSSVPEGNTPAFQLRDNMPTGLTFLNDGTTKLALASSDPGLSSSTITGAGVQASPYSETNIDTLTPSFVLPSSAISGGTGSGGAFQTGDDPLINLGNLTNTDNDTNAEYVVLEFNAIVDNTVAGSNDAGDVLNNTATVRYSNADAGTTAATPVTVAEPNVTINNTVNVVSPVKVGDTITYNLVVTNSNAANTTNAFDLRVQDAIDSRLSLVGVSVVSNPANRTITDNSSAPNVDVLISQLAPGESITLRVTATINTVNPAGQTVPNTANVSYTSLPGATGTTSNPTGSVSGAAAGATGERTGSGVAPNDYVASSSAPFSLGTIGDTVWFDADGNGSQNGASEPGLSNVTVQLRLPGPDGILDNGDDVTVSTTTNATGAYQFTGLSPANYRVTVDTTTLPAGMSATSDRDGGNDSTAVINLGPAQVVDNADFGYKGNGAIGNYVWFDANANRVQDTNEEGIGGVKVNLTWAGSDNTFGTADDAQLVTTTSGAGAYNFGNLPAGSYRTSVDATTLPVGAVATFDQDGDNNGQTSLTLGANQTRDDIDFGYRGATAFGRIVWLDVNNNGSFDGGEDGISGVKINVTWFGLDNTFGTADDIALTTTTNGDGLYNVGNLFPGSYRASVDTTTLPAGVAPRYDLDGTSTPSVADFTLTNGVNRDDVNFGYRGGASVGDLVWFDTNNNGTRDAGEPGLANIGVTVTWAGPNGMFGDSDDVATTTTTNSVGAYLVGGLPAGTYRVIVNTTDLPADTTPTTTVPQFTLVANQSKDDADFGFTGTGSIGDYVWLDRDGDGAQDVGEPGIPGVTVTVTWAGEDGDFATTQDNASYTTTTNANGGYSVDKLPAGNFRVDLSNLPGGVIATYDLDGTASASSATTSLTTAQPFRDDVDFGYVGSASIGNLVWFDANGNGTQEAGEPGLANVDLTVTWAGLDGVFGNGDDVVITTTTNASGAYVVGGLPAGNYRVSVDTADLPANTTPTTNVAPFTLTAGQAKDDADFGFEGTGTIGDLVWLDRNGNEVYDTGEVGIAGVTVNLTWAGSDNNLATTADNTSFTTTTDSNGSYNFNNLPAGLYRVEIATASLPSGLSATYDLNGGKDSTATASLTTTTPSRDDLDFGYVGNASIGDQVWYDANGNGVQDAGEPGLANITITLAWTGPDGTADDKTFTTQTDASGNYSFAGLPAGGYSVSIDLADSDLPPSLVLTTGSSPNGTSLVANEAETTIDFGFTATGSLGDRVWNDADGDGVQDGSEIGIVGAVVTVRWSGQNGIFGDSDDYVKNVITGANGIYNVSGLPAGAYRVTVDTTTLPNGFNPSYDLDGTATPSVAEVTLSTGQNKTDVDFGYSNSVPAVSSNVGDRVWLDANGNGIQDASETGIANVSLTLQGAGLDQLFGTADDTTASTTTGANGIYNFGGLAAGLYRITLDTSTLPAGLGETFEADGSLNASTDVALGSSETRTDLDFGFTNVKAGAAVGQIGDRIWNDADGDGVQDANEAGIANVDVTLTFAGPDRIFGTADDTTATTTTDTDGMYMFNNLVSGIYRVEVDSTTLPAGLNQTYEFDSSRDGSVTVTLAAGEGLTAVDFGYTSGTVVVPTGSIGDRVWLDTNGNGTQDAGEDGIGGVTIDLTWFGPDNQPNTADDQVFTQITDGTGVYSFGSLPAGSFYVSVDPATLPSGLRATFDLDGGVDSAAVVTLTAGQTRDDVDFGYTGTGSIGDFVWRDTNGNGIQDTGETGIANVPVTLIWAGNDGVFGTADDTTTTTTTASDGIYNFTGLPAGMYRVVIDSATPALAGLTERYELDGSMNGDTTVKLLGSQDRVDVDFGYTPASLGALGSIGTTVWLDLDGDGTIDADEPRISGATVTLLDAGGDNAFGTTDDVVYTQVTDVDGTYNFSGLPANNYRVFVDTGSLPPGVTETFDRDGNNDSSADVTLAAGASITNANFGYRGSAEIGNYVWDDANGDGVQDASENGIPGVDVALTWAGPDGVLGTPDDAVLTTTTDANGAYSFSNLPAGNYLVEIDTTTLPSGVQPSIDPDGGLDNTASVGITTGQIRDAIDFGYVLPEIDLSLTKSDNNAQPKAGNTIVYTLDYANVGNYEATGVKITETIPSNTSFNAAASSGGWVCTGSTCTYSIGDLARAATGSINFAVDINTLLGAGVNDISNTASISDDATHGSDVIPANNSDAVTTPVDATPDLQLTKSDNGTYITAGGKIRYTLTYSNVGNQNATGVILRERVPDYTQFDPAQSDAGWNCAATTAGSECTITIGTLAAGASGTATFSVIIDNPLPPSLAGIANQAVVVDDGTNGLGKSAAQGRNQDTDSVVTGAAPTQISLRSFTATRQPDGTVKIRWETTSEDRTVGYFLARGIDRANASRITPNIIPARGSGFIYEWIDATAPAQATSYWLQEQETSGQINEYGPASAAGTSTPSGKYQVFMPLTRR